MSQSGKRDGPRIELVDHKAVGSSRLTERIKSGDKNVLSNGSPIMFDGDFRVMQPWSEFLRLYQMNVSSNTIKSYASDLLSFARFLNEREILLRDVHNEVLVQFRTVRFAAGVSGRSWARQSHVLRTFFSYLVRGGSIEKLPWNDVGEYSVLRPRSYEYDFDVRAISREKWLHFKYAGLGGEVLGETSSAASTIAEPARNMAAAELALTTGMRLREWSTLLLYDLEETEEGYQIELEVAAKGQKRRVVHVPPATRAELEQYLATERRRKVRRLRDRYGTDSGRFAQVQGWDSAKRILTYRLEGYQYSKKIHQVPVEHRRIMAQPVKGKLESAALFPGDSGFMMVERTWQDIFSRASARAGMALAQNGQKFGRPVRPHDLRHTFAVVLLRHLQRKLVGSYRRGEMSTVNTVTEQMMFSPVLRVQRLLGHSSPRTTMNYLRFLDDSESILSEVFDSWNDPDITYAEYVLRERNEQI